MFSVDFQTIIILFLSYSSRRITYRFAVFIYFFLFSRFREYLVFIFNVYDITKKKECIVNLVKKCMENIKKIYTESNDKSISIGYEIRIITQRCCKSNTMGL